MFDDLWTVLGVAAAAVAVTAVGGAYVGARIAGPVGAAVGCVAAPVVVFGSYWVADSFACMVEDKRNER